MNVILLCIIWLTSSMLKNLVSNGTVLYSQYLLSMVSNMRPVSSSSCSGTVLSVLCQSGIVTVLTVAILQKINLLIQYYKSFVCGLHV
jgi:hypothetical protein